MIYTTADHLEHIASALMTISEEYAARVKGAAQYLRGLESTNIRLSTELREAYAALDEKAAQIDDAELDAFAARICAGNAAYEDKLSIELSNLDVIEAMELPACGETLSDLIESLARMEQP